MARTLQGFLGDKNLVQRALAIVVVWGSLAFVWGTIAEKALTTRLPPVQSHVARTAAEVGEYLAASADVLTPLLQDPRLAIGLASAEGMESREARRALYEFSYLNRLGKIWVWSAGGQAATGVPGAGDLTEDVQAWLRQTPPTETGRALVAFNPQASMPEYYVARAVTGAQGVAVVVRLSWQNLLANWPRPAGIPHYPEAQQGLLGTGSQPAWWVPLGRPEAAARQPWFGGGGADYTHDTEGRLWLWHPVAGQKNWYVATTFSYSGALGEGRTLQLALLLCAILATLWLVWQPSRGLRRQGLRKVKPMLAPAVRLVAPSIEQVRAVVRSESRPATSLATPGSHREEFAPPLRVRMLNLGSSTFNRLRGKKPLSAVAGSATAAPVPLSPEIRDVPSQSSQANGNPNSAAQAAQKEGTTTLTAMLDRALKEQRIQLLYQPVFETSTGKAVMHEAFARLADDKGHWILPETFIPELAKNGWLPRLDALVFSTVLKEHARPDANFPRLCINVGGSSIESIRYLDVLEKEEYKAIAKHLVFEVSSQELMADPQVLKKLATLKGIGVELSVDYFGGGRDMLSGAQKIGFSYVKVNALRFSASDHNKKELIILCRTAKMLGLPMVLEKVETVSMEVFARKAGIQYLQGYQLARPGPAIRPEPLQSWRQMSSGSTPEKPVEATAGAQPAAPAPAAQG